MSRRRYMGGGAGGLDVAAVQALIDAAVDTDRIVRADAVRGVAPTAGEYATPDEDDTALVRLTDETLEIWEYTGGTWVLGATQEPVTVGAQYSTTEHRTNRKWVDGKPIYEITVDCSAIANDGTLIPVGVVDTFMAIPAGSATTSTGLQVPAPYRVTSIFDALQGPDSSVYLRRTSALATPQPGDHIVLQYTKL